jgi:hypothetical protein
VVWSLGGAFLRAYRKANGKELDLCWSQDQASWACTAHREPCICGGVARQFDTAQLLQLPVMSEFSPFVTDFFLALGRQLVSVEGSTGGRRRISVHARKDEVH